jgi:predicted RNA-binding Zn-ribbon protein involved in translation (DUF1610 family)
MGATAIRCTVCGGATSIRADAARHRCEYCGSEIVWAATHQAAGEAERRLRTALEQIQPTLDALDAEAQRRAAAGDIVGAHQLVADHVRRVGELYRQTNYYAVMGIDGDDAIERNQQAAYHVHLQRLGLATSAPSAPVRASSTTAADVGIELAPVIQPDGTHVVRCVKCGADIALAHLAETVICTHCRATVRVRLEGLAVYHARGYTDVTEDDVARQRLAVAVAANQLPARVEMARGITAGMTARDETHRTEYTFVYALELGTPLGAADQAAIAAQLGLGPPTTCRACERTIALGAETTVCPMCLGKAK